MSREMSVRIVALLALGAGAALPAGLRGQCSTHWLPGDALAGANAGVNAVTLWDPDGAGPMPARLVVVGWFTVVGDVVANRIAAMDPATGHWSPLGSGIDGTVYSLAALPNGDLVAGGIFTAAGGVTASNIARWNGNAWSPLGSGTNSSVLALTTLPNGDLIAGGAFTTAGTASASRIARWNGLAWSPLGGGMNDAVMALTTLPNGDLVAGGSFTTPLLPISPGQGGRSPDRLRRCARDQRTGATETSNGARDGDMESTWKLPVNRRPSSAVSSSCQAPTLTVGTKR